MTDYTSHFRLPIPDFLQEPWHEILEETIRSIDTAVYEALLAGNAANWANSTVYAIGDIVIDATTGLMYVAAVAHTSAVSPTTFAADRIAHPTYWNRSVTIPQFRGNWATATSYTENDFVINSSRYAVCVSAHVSGVFNTDLANGLWAVLIDLSSLAPAFNPTAETSLASAATTNLGSITASRIFVTGTTGITSFGTVANTFKIVRYEGALLLTHNATSLILLGGTNKTTAAGDIQLLASDTSGNWRELHYEKADGWIATTALRGRVQLATNAEAVTGTDTAKVMTPAAHKAGFDSRFFPAGTALVFWQAAAPTLWTKQVTHNDKALRIVSGTGGGSGGSSAFTTVFGKTATDATTLSRANLPQVDLISVDGAGNVPVITDGVSNATTVYHMDSGTGGISAVTGGSNLSYGDPSITGHIYLNANVGQTGHTHPIDIRVQYLDCIICTKD